MNAVDHEPPTTDSAKGSTFRRRAIVISVAAHIVLVVVLLVVYLPDVTSSGDASRTSSTSSPAEPSEPAEPSPDPTESVDGPNPKVPAEDIQASIESTFKQYEDVPDEKKLDDLGKNLRRLKSLGTDESIAEVTEVIAGSLGLEPVRTEPAQGETGKPFESISAQLTDVVRTRKDDGSWQYHAQMVDAHGNTERIEMDAQAGQTAYATFQQLKKYPFAEAMYQRIVAPLMKDLIDAKQATEKAAAHAAQLEQSANATRKLDSAEGTPTDVPSSTNNPFAELPPESAETSEKDNPFADPAPPSSEPATEDNPFAERPTPSEPSEVDNPFNP